MGESLVPMQASEAHCKIWVRFLVGIIDGYPCPGEGAAASEHILWEAAKQSLEWT